MIVVVYHGNGLCLGWVNSTLSVIKNSVTSRIFQRVKHKDYNDIQGILYNLNF